ncbi:MAG: hypothetical protein ACTHM5_11760 [Ginsengibacter sp.]
MKKLKLDFQHIEGFEVLTRSQLKKILGGDGGSGGCSLSACTTDSDCAAGYCKTISCTWPDDGASGSYTICAAKGE